MMEFPLLLVFPVAMMFAAAFDLLTMTIPNKISLALVAAFFVVAPMSGLSALTIAIHAATGFGILAIGFFLFTRGFLGGGDAKLLAASALWLGYDSLLDFMMTVSLLGGALSVAILMFRRLPNDMVAGPSWLMRLHSKDSGIPYGLAIGGAALMLYPHTHWFEALFA